MIPDLTLTVITDRALAEGRSQAAIMQAAIRGGATVVQLRDKDAGGREMAALGEELLGVTRPARVPLIVNDRVDVALALGAEGAHVGQADLPARYARRLLGGALLGVSAGNLAEALQAAADGADYLGVGPVFPAPTKPDAGEPIGLETLRLICERIALPVVAIGGINHSNAAEVIRAGAAGVAVISAITGSRDPERAAREMREIIQQARLEIRR